MAAAASPDARRDSAAIAFGGFEGAAPLAEEARNPRRTIQRAVLLATLLIGARTSTRWRN